MRSLFGAATLLAAVVLASAVLRLEAGRAAPPEDVASLIRRLDPSIAHVTVRIQGDRPDASRDDGVGAGFVYRSDGQIVTSRHVLQGALEVFVTLPGHGTMPARVLGQDPVTDVALLQVAATGLVPLGIGDPRTLAKGDPVLVAGSPFHLERSWSAGIVSGLHRSQIGVNPRGYEDYIQTDAATNLGNSGGPMVDRGGRVVGVMTAILSRTGRSQGVALATPIDAVVAALARIQRGAGPQRPTLGLVVRERDTRGTLRPGLTISRFEPRSPVRDAGVLPGDILLAIDGTPTARTADLQRIVWSHQAGEIVALTLERNGRRYDVRVRLR
jgi:serine protease DegQ